MFNIICIFNNPASQIFSPYQNHLHFTCTSRKKALKGEDGNYSTTPSIKNQGSGLSFVHSEFSEDQWFVGTNGFCD